MDWMAKFLPKEDLQQRRAYGLPMQLLTTPVYTHAMMLTLVTL